MIGLLLALLSAAELAAAKSGAASICMGAGSAVLSEYQKNLKERYGIYAVRSDIVCAAAEYYISMSAEKSRTVTGISFNGIKCDTDPYMALNTRELKKQIKRAAASQLLRIDDGAEPPAKPDEYSEKISEEMAAALPSGMLGYSRRLELLFAGGLAELDLGGGAVDLYILQACSNRLNAKDTSYLRAEAEYILYGNLSDEANISRVEASIYELCLAYRTVQKAIDAKIMTPEVIAVLLAEAAVEAADDKSKVIKGESVEFAGVAEMNYGSFLLILLNLLGDDEKIARLMDVMQLNISVIDNTDFEFRNYCYGFEMDASFENNTVRQTFRYK